MALAKEAAKGKTISRDDAQTLWEWAAEYGVPRSHPPKADPQLSPLNRWGGVEHVKINGLHIEVRG